MLARGGFASVSDLNAAIRHYINFSNTLARPVNWTYDGAPETKPEKGALFKWL